MKNFLIITTAYICLAFALAKDPMKTFVKLFPEQKLLVTDTVHFGPNAFKAGTFNPERNRLMSSLLNDTAWVLPSSDPDAEFWLPLMHTKMNGREVFIVEYGDTNEIWIYTGKHVYLYLYDQKTGFSRPLELAWGIAGEGPWFRGDSWLLDLNRDGKTDILTREIGEYVEREDEDGVDTWNFVTVDNLTAKTLSDTGFVSIPVPNPDSLREIYRNY